MSSFLWGIYARWYDLLRTLYSYQKLHDRVVKRLELIPHLRVLDVGCGTGNTIERVLAEGVHGTKIVGFDPTPHMLDRARKKIRHKSVKFIARLPAEEQFDRILSINSFYTMPHPYDVARTWYDMLEDGGLLVLANPFRPKLFDIFREHFHIALEKRDRRAFVRFFFQLPLWICLIATNLVIAKLAAGKVYSFFSEEELDAVFLQAGFSKVSCEEIYGNTDLLCTYKKDTGAPIRRAQTEEEIEAVCRLRYEVYCEELKSLPSTSFPDGLERDRFDRFAVHFIARQNTSIIGCVRLVRDAQGNLLLEEGFPMPGGYHSLRESLIEISRWIVQKEWRGTGLWYELVERAIEWARRNGYSTFAMAARENLWEGLKKRGWHVDLWGGYQQYHDTLSAPGSFSCRTL